MKFKGAYREAVRRLNVVPIPPAPRPFVAPVTREEALVRLGAVNVAIVKGGKHAPSRANLVAELLQIQTLLATTLRRRPTPRKEAAPPRMTKADTERIPYVGPRCDHCGGEAPGGACVNEGPDYPHPRKA